MHMPPLCSIHVALMAFLNKHTVYNSHLNSVKGNSSKQVIHDKFATIPSESKSILFTNSGLNSALKSLKRSKACGVDGLAAEHFIYAHSITHVFLSLLFNDFIRHGHLPTDFKKTAIVPIIKNQTGHTSDKNNYRPIALVTATSILFEFVCLKFYKCTSLDLKQNILLTCVFLLYNALSSTRLDITLQCTHVFLVRVRLLIELTIGHYLQNLFIVVFHS